MDRVVEIFKQQRQSDAESKRKEQRDENCARAVWTNREVRRQREVDYGNIVGLAGRDNFVLLRALQQVVEQLLVGLNFLLNDSVVDGGFVLRKRFAALLFKRGAQGLLAPKRLPVDRFQVGQNVRAL